jgi:hypothetical protein
LKVLFDQNALRPLARYLTKHVVTRFPAVDESDGPTDEQAERSLTVYFSRAIW